MPPPKRYTWLTSIAGLSIVVSSVLLPYLFYPRDEPLTLLWALPMLIGVSCGTGMMLTAQVRSEHPRYSQQRILKIVLSTYGMRLIPLAFGVLCALLAIIQRAIQK
jgi:hypothetical protein